jgi:mannose-6-phosphate isomerase-like protein (cupin superfamily)
MKTEFSQPMKTEVSKVILNNSMGGVIHYTLPSGTKSQKIKQNMVRELWYITAGSGEIWRKNCNEESIVPLSVGVSIDIPLGTEFQYKSSHNSELIFTCVIMPKWPETHVSG